MTAYPTLALVIAAAVFALVYGSQTKTGRRVSRWGRRALAKQRRNRAKRARDVKPIHRERQRRAQRRRANR